MAVLLKPTSIRDFAMAYASKPIDLFAISASNRRFLRMGVKPIVDPFSTFRDRKYKHLVMLDVLTTLHMTPSSLVVRYVKDNKTVASVWPRLDPWPSAVIHSSDDALEWYQGPVITSYL